MGPGFVKQVLGFSSDRQHIHSSPVKSGPVLSGFN